MHTTIQVLERAEQAAPDEYIAHILKEGYTSAFGAVAAKLKEDGKDAIVRVAESGTLEFIQGIRAAYPSVSRLYSFTKADGQVHEDDLQPFTLLVDNNDQPLVVVCINGGSDQFKGDIGSAKSTAFFYTEGYLTKFVGDAFDTLDGDLSKLDKFLSKETILDSIVHSFGKQQTSMVLMLADAKGSIRTIYSLDDNPDTNVTTEWGWTSALLGWGAKKAEPATSVKKSLEQILADAKAGKELPPITAGDKKEDKKDQPPRGATPDTNPEWFFKADKAWSQDRKRAEYDAQCGRVPDNYKQCPWVQRQQPQPVKAMRDIKSIPEIASVEPIKPPKKKATAPPFLTAEQTKDLHDKFAVKYYTMDGKSVRNPWDYLKFEEEYPTFSNLIGCNVDETINMDPDARYELLINHPEAMVNWSIELCLALRHAYEDMARLKTELEARILREKDKKTA